VNDTEVGIRRIVAQRIDADDLTLMVKDTDWTVRYEVALRAPPALLEKMLDDVDEEVRQTARQCWEAITSEPVTRSARDGEGIHF
ncbi:MAG: 4Fe4S-binding leucine-rich repeat protein, partial [Gammaproteobacteria bacterium]